MSRWPVVFGVIGIITAAFGLLGGGCDMVMPAGMLGSASGSPDVPASPQPWTALLSAGDFLLAGLLMAASIGMLRRRDWSVRTAVLWSWAKSVTAVGDGILTAVTFRRSVPLLRNLLPPEVLTPETMNILLIGAVCISLVLGLSTPVFVLVWFRRARIRAEVATWAAPRSAAIR
jgi:hypothetical protein